MSNDIYFVVETALVDDNRKLQALTPDDDGFKKAWLAATLFVPMISVMVTFICNLRILSVFPRSSQQCSLNIITI